MTLRRKLLVLLIAAAATPVLVSGLLAYRGAELALRNALRELHTRAAAAEAEHAHAYVQAYGTELSSALLYEDPAVLSPAEVQELLTRVYLRRNRTAIAALLDRKGAVRATVFMDDPEAFARQEPQFRAHDTVTADEAFDFAHRAAALLEHAPAGQGWVVSEPYLPKSRRKPAVVVLAPAGPGRSLSLAAELTLDDIRAHLAANRFEGAQAFLLDRNGRLLLHPDGSRLPLHESFAARLPDAVDSHVSGLREYRDQDAVWLAGYSPVGELGWTAVVARPADQALAPLSALTRSTGLVLFFSLVAVALLGALGARAMARPIALLADGARAIAQGQFGHRIQLEREDELGALAKTFNDMGRSVEEANHKLVRFNEELQQQVEERTRELRLAQEQLLRSQRLAAVGDLAAGLAHEVNNPLCAIVGNAQLLMMDFPEQHRAHGPLSDMLEQALRISDIVRGMQTLAEQQRGGRAEVNVHDVLERVVEGRADELQRHGVEVTRRFAGNAAEVLGDESALREVFGHLLSNSVNAVSGRPMQNIVVSTSVVDGQAVLVEVSDTGRGIPKQHLDRIFNPFFSTKRQWNGRGLALSICHRIIENHGGKISIQSEENVGTTVTVVLPAAPPKPHLR